MELPLRDPAPSTKVVLSEDAVELVAVPVPAVVLVTAEVAVPWVDDEGALSGGKSEGLLRDF